MELIVPFAAVRSDAGHAALRTLALPRLRAWLGAADLAARDDGDEWSFSPPHERALARAWGWRGGDGALPFAARAAAADGIDTGDLAWGLLSPAHWHLGTEQLSLLDPEALLLDAATSRCLFDAVAPLFTSEGFAVRYGAPTRWYLAHESLAGLRCASLDRVIGRNVDRWLAADPAARLVRRLQNEVQMVFHSHAANAGREADGRLAVNSVWLSGCGTAQPATGEAELDDRLRTPALAEDWAGWARAWQTLDDGPIAALGDGALTLCGERGSVRLLRRGGAWRRLRAWIAPPDPVALLETL